MPSSSPSPSLSSSPPSSDSSPPRLTTRATSNDSKRRKAAKTAKKAEMIRARKVWAEVCMQHKPLKWINKRMLPSDTNKPPLLHFGIGVKIGSLDAGESLVHYAKEIGFYQEIYDDDGTLDCGATGCCAASRAVSYLSHKFSFELEIIVPFSVRYGIVVAVYSNWDVEDNRLPPKKEIEIFDAIRQAVGDAEQVPLWYHDSLEKEGQWRFLPRSRPFRKPTLSHDIWADFDSED
ncbi:hypothetical protein K488DRAFT_89141 [Vararia minispora EC-137]|uniref:Uncharacterized protein n=1 Tax=Vararia minispora EC-137 TaxID=1314806 RepID=A0ACB8QB49_9AGAM|nr:hypothetical protein K488DRAFT_89141 [Vararia minispora EC-137]